MDQKESTDWRVAQLESAIRDYINKPRQHRVLAAESNSFNTLCSALDAIGDAETGISAYLEMTDPGESGGRYVAVYGLLQILFVEQDAVAAVVKILGAGVLFSDGLAEIRDIRNYSVGHPVPNQKNKPAGFISRAELSLKNLRVMWAWPDGRYEYKRFDIHKLIETQRREISKILSSVLEAVRNEEMVHRSRYRSMKLRLLLHPSTSWLLQRVGGVRTGDEASMAQAHLSMVIGMIDKVEAALAERDRSETVEYLLKDIRFSAAKLSLYFGQANQTEDDFMTADVFASHLNQRIEELGAILAEIDQEYESNE